MKETDFYIEYLSTLEKMVLRGIEPIRPILQYGPYSFERSTRNFLWYNRLKYRDVYCKFRIAGKSIDESLKAVEIPILKEMPPSLSFKRENINIKEISGLSNHIAHDMFVVFNPRHWEYLQPLIEKYKTESVLFVDMENILPSTSYIRPIECKMIEERLYRNYIFESNFSFLWIFVNTFIYYLEYLMPRKVILVDGCQTKYQMIGEICSVLEIPTICIQYGWPSIIHAGFKDLPYDWFISWGDRYSDFLKPYNKMQFISLGHLHSGSISHNKKKRITFILQDYLFISSEEIRNSLLDIAVSIASRNPEYCVSVRNHPTLILSRKLDITHLNVAIDIVDDINIYDLYRESLVIVSQFSSCIAESTFFGCKSVVFDPVKDSYYVPDIELNNMGYFTKNIADCIMKIQEVINEYNCSCQKNFPIEMPESNACQNSETLKTVVDFIQSL